MPRRFDNAPDAVSAGQWYVNGPVGLLLFGVPFASLKLLTGYACGICFVGSWCAAWLWWSIAVPRWRRWVLDSNLDLLDVQVAGVRAGLIWPAGSFFERTELPRTTAVEWKARLDAEFAALEAAEDPAEERTLEDGEARR